MGHMRYCAPEGGRVPVRPQPANGPFQGQVLNVPRTDDAPVAWAVGLQDDSGAARDGQLHARVQLSASGAVFSFDCDWRGIVTVPSASLSVQVLWTGYTLPQNEFFVQAVAAPTDTQTGKHVSLTETLGAFDLVIPTTQNVPVFARSLVIIPLVAGWAIQIEWVDGANNTIGVDTGAEGAQNEFAVPKNAKTVTILSTTVAVAAGSVAIWNIAL